MRTSLLAFVERFAHVVANEPQRGAQAPRVFYVGGAVRDRVRGDDDVSDVDVEVYGLSAERVQEILERLAERRVDVFGAVFGIFSLTFDDGVLDVALPRTESKKGRGHTGFAITGDPHLSYADALRRRDFTMNAMLADVLTGEIIDPFGGRDDIVHGVVRIVDERTFADDPLRAFRAMQFVARFGYTVETKSFVRICGMATSAELALLSPERVTAEWKKMLCGIHAVAGLRFLADTGLLALYPELDVLRRVEQDPHWHPEGSVWEHVLRCWEFAVPDHVRNDEGALDLVTYRLALLLHDVGKGVVTKGVGKKISDEGHARVGVEIAKVFFDRLAFGDVCERDVLACIAHHEVLPELYRAERYDDISEEKSANALRILWRDVGVERIPLFLAVCEANARGRDLPLDDRPYPVRVWAEDLTRRYGLLEAASSPLLSGTDVQNIALRLQVALPKGKAFGMMLADIESARDRGEIVAKHEAIAYVERILTKGGICTGVSSHVRRD